MIEDFAGQTENLKTFEGRSIRKKKEIREKIKWVGKKGVLVDTDLVFSNAASGVFRKKNIFKNLFEQGKTHVKPQCRVKFSYEQSLIKPKTLCKLAFCRTLTPRIKKPTFRDLSPCISLKPITAKSRTPHKFFNLYCN